MIRKKYLFAVCITVTDIRMDFVYGLYPKCKVCLREFSTLGWLYHFKIVYIYKKIVDILICDLKWILYFLQARLDLLPRTIAGLQRPLRRTVRWLGSWFIAFISFIADFKKLSTICQAVGNSQSLSETGFCRYFILSSFRNILHCLFYSRLMNLA